MPMAKLAELATFFILCALLIHSVSCLKEPCPDGESCDESAVELDEFPYPEDESPQDEQYGTPYGFLKDLFGSKRGHSFLRIGKRSGDASMAEIPSSLGDGDDYAKRGNKFLRIGRGWYGGYKRGHKFLRIGRSGSDDKRAHKFLRIGKSSSQVEQADELGVPQLPSTVDVGFDKRGNKFLRIGKSMANKEDEKRAHKFLRIGKSDSADKRTHKFLRIGRLVGLPAEEAGIDKRRNNFLRIGK